MKTALAWALVSAAAVSLASLAGCGPSVSLATPPGFAVLDHPEEYVYRATSADGVVIAVRAEKNEPRGNLDFWSEALDRQLRHGGYTPDGDPSEVRTSAGFTGREARYRRDQGGRSYRFWTTVFVTDKRVYIAEAGGDADRFKEKAQKGVQKAIESIGVD